MQMFPWLWIWNPQFHFPWSDSVAQRIEPITLFDSIGADAGDGKIEKIKEDEAVTLVQDIEARVDKLRRSNQVEYARLCAKLQPMLTQSRG
jgi:hypothetical protein